MKMILKKRKKVFERKKMIKSIAMAKKVRADYDRANTKEIAEKGRTSRMYEDMSEMLTVAIEAMETILYDL